MRAVLPLLLLLVSSCGVVPEGTYLACTGHSGTSPLQDVIPLLSRTITANEGSENGSIFVGANKVAVEGIPWMMGEYNICENSNQVVLFSPACNQTDPDKFHDLGILNKVTGDVRYHVGEMLFILKCSKAAKVVK